VSARRLGYSGLLPFFVGAALVWLVHDELQPVVATWLAGYAAVIVSFLGGVHWGLAMRSSSSDTQEFGWAMAPPLVAWLALVMPPHAGLVLLAVMLIVCYLVDRRYYAAQGMAPWLNLRFRLSMLASASCFLAAAGS
jgi:putative flippase GtrA